MAGPSSQSGAATRWFDAPERRPAVPQASGAPCRSAPLRNEERPLFGYAKHAECTTGSNPVFRHTNCQPGDALLGGPVRIPVLPQVCCEPGRGDLSETAASSGFSRIPRRYDRGPGVFSENDGWRADYQSLKGLAADGGPRDGMGQATRRWHHRRWQITDGVPLCPS